MPENVLVISLMAAFVAFLAGAGKGGMGGVISTLAAPLMALVLPTNEAIGLTLPMLIIADVFALAIYWNKWQMKYVWLMLPTAVIGVTLGTYIITTSSGDLLKVLLVIIVTIFAIYKLFEKRIMNGVRYQPHNWHGVLAGAVAGFASALAHNGTPPVAIYLLMQGVRAEAFNATAVIFFFILNLVKVPYYTYAGLFDWALLWQLAWVIPLIPLGAWAGKWAADKIEREMFERVVIGALIFTGVVLLFV